MNLIFWKMSKTKQSKERQRESFDSSGIGSEHDEEVGEQSRSEYSGTTALSNVAECVFHVYRASHSDEQAMAMAKMVDAKLAQGYAVDISSNALSLNPQNGEGGEYVCW